MEPVVFRPYMELVVEKPSTLKRIKGYLKKLFLLRLFA